MCSSALTPRPPPLQVLGLRGKKVTAVSCGDTHTLVVADYLPYAFGTGEFGQLGLGVSVTKTFTPQPIEAVRGGGGGE